MLDDYPKALENLHKADVLEPNNAFTLNVHGVVTKKMDDY
jgi:Flp pilus assembly protein TadD